LTGIINFSLGTINNSSELSQTEGGYVDFSCTGQTTLTAGQKIPVSVTTNSVTSENVKVWIDLNADGSFTYNELVFSSDSKTGVHSGAFIVPVPISYNNLLRLRVVSDLSNYPFSDACNDLEYGQAEDYAVMIAQNTTKPFADFGVINVVVVSGDSVSFTNLSLNVPETYEWYFPGGNPSVSYLENPKVFYSAPGDYNAKLIVKNAFGSDTLIKNGISKIRNPLLMKSDSSTSETNGLLFDSGGPTDKYLNNEKSEFHIHIPCASEIRVVFQMLDIESCCDYIQIFDGTDQTGKLLYPLSNSTKYDTLIARSGNVYITFTSDGSMVKKGFAMEWTSNAENAIPINADFSISDTQVAYNESEMFVDNSSGNVLNWSWDFGDGSISSLENPSHSYKTAGLKNVKLVVSNCFSSDTIIRQLSVAPPPVIEVDRQNIDIQLTEGDSEVLDLNIRNISEDGILDYAILITDQTGNLEKETCSWLRTSLNGNVLSPDDSDRISLTIDASDLSGGLYTAEIAIFSNDPSDSIKIVQVVLEVKDILPVPFQVLIPDQVISLNEIKKLSLKNFNLNTGSDLKINLLNSDNTIVNVEILNDEVIMHPLTVGESIITLKIRDGLMVSVDTFKIAVLENGSVPVKEIPVSEIQNLSMYPNPARERINFNSDFANGKVEYTIINLSGQIVMKDQYESDSTLSRSSIDIYNLQPGIYIVELSGNDRKYTAKFIKE
jgi:PKD repeat protein